MANHKTTDQPGSNDMQANHKRTRNQQAHDTSGQRPNAERVMTNANKSKQGPENNHANQGMSETELANERGGHGHSGHSDSRNGSRK